MCHFLQEALPDIPDEAISKDTLSLQAEVVALICDSCSQLTEKLLPLAKQSYKGLWRGEGRYVPSRQTQPYTGTGFGLQSVD